MFVFVKKTFSHIILLYEKCMKIIDAIYPECYNEMYENTAGV